MCVQQAIPFVFVYNLFCISLCYTFFFSFLDSMYKHSVRWKFMALQLVYGPLTADKASAGKLFIIKTLTSTMGPINIWVRLDVEKSFYQTLTLPQLMFRRKMGLLSVPWTGDWRIQARKHSLLAAVCFQGNAFMHRCNLLFLFC